MRTDGQVREIFIPNSRESTCFLEFFIVSGSWGLGEITKALKAGDDMPKYLYDIQHPGPIAMLKDIKLNT